MSRSEIRGTTRGAYEALLRARQALLEAVEDDEVMLTPADMDGIYATLKHSQTVLTDIKKLTAQFGTVAEARKAIAV